MTQGRNKVLIVDPDREYAAILRLAAIKAGWEVTYQNSSSRAISFLSGQERDHVHQIFLDPDVYPEEELIDTVSLAREAGIRHITLLSNLADTKRIQSLAGALDAPLVSKQTIDFRDGTYRVEDRKEKLFPKPELHEGSRFGHEEGSLR